MEEEYTALLTDAAAAVAGLSGLDLTVELITHRFTATSKRVLSSWYPNSRLDMDEELRTMKRTRFRGQKHVYPAPVMAQLRAFFAERVHQLLPAARILYFT